MDTRVVTNVAAIIAKMVGRAGSINTEMAAAARRLAPRLEGESKRILQAEIYDVPIPLKASISRKTGAAAAIRKKTTKGKLGMWQRTGALKRAESATAEGSDVILRNNQNYARHRHSLGTSGHRQIKTPGVRSVQWQPKAISNLRPQILEERRKAILRALNIR